MAARVTEESRCWWGPHISESAAQVVRTPSVLRICASDTGIGLVGRLTSPTKHSSPIVVPGKNEEVEPVHNIDCNIRKKRGKMHNLMV